jgi:hypothetical protein
MHCVFLFGEPGCGKTTLVRDFLKTCGEKSLYKHGLVECELYHEKKIIVLGFYTDNPFSGTDRLSMGVQKDLPGFLQTLVDDPYWKGWCILGEGARIATRPAIEAFTTHCGVVVYFLCVVPEELERRRASRNNTQNKAWLRGMRTKLVNLESAIYESCTVILADFTTDAEVQVMQVQLRLSCEKGIELGVL